MVFGKEYIMRCSSAEWIECLDMMPSWCGQVNWGNCGIPWVKCAVLCVWKTTGKDSSEACATACQNCAVYSVFPSGVTTHSKIAQFNWECIAPWTVNNWLRRCRCAFYRVSEQGVCHGTYWRIQPYVLLTFAWWCNKTDIQQNGWILSGQASYICTLMYCQNICKISPVFLLP